MKRLPMSEIRRELDREIKAVYKLKNQAFDDQDLTSFFRLSERLDGLHYARHLIRGNMDILACYQTGLRQNSNGAKYTPKEGRR
tara:strand:- start:85 stop:336 length:252 start_codon:yes stop_codon:yes gene_type:complete